MKKREWKEWSKHEVLYLMTNYDCSTMSRIAEALNRSLSSVKNRARLIGLKKNKPILRRLKNENSTKDASRSR